ncbi:hypothetical protein SUDANB171_04107 [Streptomyces sp. enrichment culture]|uniref:SMI1/KNR4 family protein n=1 Tax=Streptomyces sp. enrichment culture TaxID=1795815 RepID=UPI003F552B43
MDDIDTSDVVAPTLSTPAQWREYLHAYGELAVRADDAPRRWAGRPPATEEAVAAAEARLGLRFPPSYRGFLLTTDGWDDVGCWAGPVLPLARTGWLRDTRVGRDHIELYGEEGGEDDPYVVVFRRVLEITTGEDAWYLDPSDVGPDGEWAGYLFTPKYGELTRFSGFAALWQHNRETLERFAADRAART